MSPGPRVRLGRGQAGQEWRSAAGGARGCGGGRGGGRGAGVGGVAGVRRVLARVLPRLTLALAVELLLPLALLALGGLWLASTPWLAFLFLPSTRRSWTFGCLVPTELSGCFKPFGCGPNTTGPASVVP